jgi:hypothetical protein
MLLFSSSRSDPEVEEAIQPALHLATPQELDGVTITIRQSGDNEEVEITHKDCNTPHRTSEVMINPAGTQRAEAERLLEKGKQIAAKVPYLG